jgi:hypothetical protein
VNLRGRWTRSTLPRLCVVAAFLAGFGAACTSTTGSDSSSGNGGADWYYHWSCNGDPECLSLGPGADGQASGTLNEGPVYANCSALLTFASKNWNIPPATNSCDHSPTGEGGDGGTATKDGAAPPGPGSVKRIFSTRSAYSGDLKTAGASATSGLDGADKLCALAATAAGLGGAWKAWLSDSTTDAIDRIADVGPWYLVDGTTKVFNNKANLATSPLTNGIQMDENGKTGDWAPNPGTWTGTGLGGRKKADPRDTAKTWCSDWSSAPGGCLAIFGNLTAADQTWTDWATGVGNIPAGHLYCIEQ